MSVINQMLKDLEQRRAQGFDNDPGMLDDLDAGVADSRAPGSKQRGLWIIVSLLFLLIAMLVWLVIKDRLNQEPAVVAEVKQAPVVKPIKPVQTKPQPVIVAETETVAAQEPVVEKTEQPVISQLNKTVEPLPQAVEVNEIADEEIKIQTILPSPLLARGTREIITVYGSGFSQPLSVTMEWDGGRAFKELEPWQVEFIKPTEIQLHVNLGTTSDDWRMLVTNKDSGKQAEYKFIVDAGIDEVVEASVPEETAPKKAETTINKQKRALSKDEQIGVAYAKASNFLQQGLTDKAKQSLREVLLLDFAHLQARQTLAALLFREQAYDDAIEVLDLGRIQHPRHVPFRLLLARIHTERGQDPLAVELLEQLQPAVAQNSDYYGLLAALYQRSAQHQKAASVYQKLLNSYPGKAVWWMGLGLSLQSSQQNSDALIAYNKALQTKGLTAELRRFIKSRIVQLQG